jgi:peptide-methionine (S)-S-oxide reductase
MIEPSEALPGRNRPEFTIPTEHAVLGASLQPPFPDGFERAAFALGCFWGAERLFWELEGVHTTAVGYSGGFSPNPTYEEVCSGKTGHAEAVLVVFDPARLSYADLLKVFFEAHDPTQGMRQGNDTGTQYRSALYPVDERQEQIATATRDAYGAELKRAGRGEITTEIAPAGPFYYAEEYHQQYLHKVPHGYCGLEGTGVSCPIRPVAATQSEESTSMSTNGHHDDLPAVPATDAEWRDRLTPEQYKVLRKAGTEPPFSGEYVDTDENGLYRCAACGNPLFRSTTKFHSGTGWPSFTDAVSPEAVELVRDRTFGMVRTEVRCARCESHLGHLFDDGPRDAGGKRFCMNSLSLDLDEVSDVVAAGQATADR